MVGYRDITHEGRDALPQLLIATTNAGKLEEIKALLKDMAIVLVSPVDIGISLQVEEDGTTYAENAAKKALAYARASNMLTLADDTGLEVDALEGAPGLYSSRFAPGEQVTDARRRAYLLERLSPFARPWTARFRCTVAIAKPEGEVFFTEGVCPGEIIPEEKGAHGFGYDVIFLIPSLNKTMAELPMAVKNQISHRAKAVQKAQTILLDLLSSRK